MWTGTPVFLEDLEQLTACKFIPWAELNGKTVFITGATGLIGYTLVSALLYYNKIYDAGIRVIALVRDLEQARAKFGEQLAEGCNLSFACGAVEELPEIEGQIDCIVHGACPTASNFFLQHPVETIQIITEGTKNVLEMARKKHVFGMVYLSSMEVFGEVRQRKELHEEDLGYIDLLLPRSSYSEGKRLAENMCCAYASQYQVPVTIARLAQTFGPGVARDDKRVFAYMTRCAMNREDICLNTNGAKENMYLYTTDAVSAILLLLLKGDRGAAYNVGNPETYCSVKEMAEQVAAGLGEGKISVIIRCGSSALYPSESFLKLDIAKLRGLKWKPVYTLPAMFRRMWMCF